MCVWTALAKKRLIEEGAKRCDALLLAIATGGAKRVETPPEHASLNVGQWWSHAELSKEKVDELAISLNELDEFATSAT